MKTQVIYVNDVEDLQEGDNATFRFNGHSYPGTVYTVDGGPELFFADWTVKHADGSVSEFAAHHFHYATRVVPVPEPPAEPLSVITNVVTTNGTYRLAVRCNDDWWTAWDQHGFSEFFSPKELISFDFAKVVAADA